MISKEFATTSSQQPDITSARIMLYALCIRDNIKLSTLSKLLGKDRSTIRKFLIYQENNKSVPNGLINWIYNLYKNNKN